MIHAHAIYNQISSKQTLIESKYNPRALFMSKYRPRGHFTNIDYLCAHYLQVNIVAAHYLQQGSKFTVSNVQFATGSMTFAPNRNKLGSNFRLQLFAHFHNKYIFCSLLDQLYS